MAPWFNIFMDGVITEVKAPVMDKGANMEHYTKREWEMRQLLLRMTQPSLHTYTEKSL